MYFLSGVCNLNGGLGLSQYQLHSKVHKAPITRSPGLVTKFSEANSSVRQNKSTTYQTPADLKMRIYF